MSRPDRPLVRQLFYASALIVPATPSKVPLSQGNQQAALETMITSFTLSVPVGGANSIWVGASNVDSALFNGIEIAVGTTKTFAVNTSRQLYELQEPLINQQACLLDPLALPFPVWDMSTWFASATAQITVGLVLFPEMFK